MATVSLEMFEIALLVGASSVFVAAVLHGGLVMVAIVFGAVALSIVIDLVRHRFSWLHPEDERKMKIMAQASFNTFVATVLLFAGMASLHDLDLLPEIGTEALLVTGMIVMVLIFAGWFVYYTVRGDVA